MRRQEFHCSDPERLNLLLRSARIGHLAFLRDGGLELLPYNFVLGQEFLYFHCSPNTGLAGARGQRVRFLAYDRVAWIPSTWRHPELACPATTYFFSVSLESELQEVQDLGEKAEAMESFMMKYQPEEPYKPLSDKVYSGPLKALFVGRLKVENSVVKLKMGQHLTAKQRATVFSKLRERGAPGDAAVTEAMLWANPDLSLETVRA